MLTVVYSLISIAEFKKMFIPRATKGMEIPDEWKGGQMPRKFQGGGGGRWGII